MELIVRNRQGRGARTEVLNADEVGRGAIEDNTVRDSYNSRGII